MPGRSRSVAGMGFVALDRIYSPDRPRPIECLGGSCGNVLTSLSMLGHRVDPILALGDDQVGSFLVEELDRLGCSTGAIVRTTSRSPVIVQHLDPRAALHRFSTTCPETKQRFSPFAAMAVATLNKLALGFDDISVFYVDRVSAAAVLAMEFARHAGALVVFEPSEGGEPELFARALQSSSVVKFSDDVAVSEVDQSQLPPGTTVVRTHGARGLTVCAHGDERLFASIAAPRLIDTCGAGDMVTVGLLDHLMQFGDCIDHEAICEGVKRGQRLAAVNCAFAGARGAFGALGATAIRESLDAVASSSLPKVLSIDAYAGYGI